MRFSGSQRTNEGFSDRIVGKGEKKTTTYRIVRHSIIVGVVHGGALIALTLGGLGEALGPA